ncbi:uroporphyrinogen-III synthase [Magnetovibrio sp.]|uniref:uroporphyrinogen-III synthase n=1 Tax=Magnetovibrio sp. TaxID=2024836 RepID=UPI002F92FBE8
MRILVTRPAEDSKPLIDALTQLGHEGVSMPLLDIALIDGPELDLHGTQALLFTSANGARAFAARSGDRDLPALCVGDATAREALALGFETVKSAAGDVEALAVLVVKELNPAAGTLLHPAGSKVAGDLAVMVQAAGFTYRREVLYEAIKAEHLPDDVLNELKTGTVDAVVLYSPRTGSAFAQLIDKAGARAHLKTVDAYCLSAAVAEQIKDLAWRDILIAAHPDQASLLALLDT